jgi:hypothetical protein
MIKLMAALLMMTTLTSNVFAQSNEQCFGWKCTYFGRSGGTNKVYIGPVEDTQEEAKEAARNWCMEDSVDPCEFYKCECMANQ